MRRWSELVQPAQNVGTVSALIDWYLAEVAPKKAPRTFKDNVKEAEYLRAGLGAIPYTQLRPHHVAKYRDTRGEVAPVRANRERALLSHVYTCAMERGMVDFNPCKGVKRNPESKRERMIEDSEYAAVHVRAESSVRRMMTLIYRTCQRPEDLLRVGPADIKKVEHEGRDVRVLRIKQAKTGKTVDIVVAGELETIINEHLNAKTVWPTFVHTRAGKKYTYSGLVAMFSRYVKGVGLSDFGLYDCKAKGASDMYRAGVPIERIQQLLGHESVTTTEVYIKTRLPEVAMPNMRELRKDDGCAR